MTKFPEIMIVRYYELDWMEITYSDDWSEENKNKIWKRLRKESNIKNWLEYYEVIYKWEKISREEER